MKKMKKKCKKMEAGPYHNRLSNEDDIFQPSEAQSRQRKFHFPKALMIKTCIFTSSYNLDFQNRYNVHRKQLGKDKISFSSL